MKYNFQKSIFAIRAMFIRSLLIVLPFFVFSCGAAQHSEPAPPPDAHLLSIVPSGAKWVGSLNMAGLRASKWWSRIENFGKSSKEIQQLEEEAGVNPFVEVSSILVASYSSTDPEKRLAVVKWEGWTLEKIQETLRSHSEDKAAWQEKKESGVTFWKKEKMNAVFVPDHTVVMCPDSLLPQILAILNGQAEKSLGSESAFADLVNTSEAFSVAGRDIDLSPLGMLMPPLAGMKIELFNLSVRLDTELHASFNATVKKKKQARRLENLLNRMLDETRKQPTVRLLGLDQFFDAIVITREGSIISGKITLLENQLNDLFNLIDRINQVREALEGQDAPPLPQPE